MLPQQQRYEQRASPTSSRSSPFMKAKGSPGVHPTEPDMTSSVTNYSDLMKAFQTSRLCEMIKVQNPTAAQARASHAVCFRDFCEVTASLCDDPSKPATPAQRTPTIRKKLSAFERAQLECMVGQCTLLYCKYDFLRRNERRSSSESIPTMSSKQSTPRLTGAQNLSARSSAASGQNHTPPSAHPQQHGDDSQQRRTPCKKDEDEALTAPPLGSRIAKSESQPSPPSALGATATLAESCDTGATVSPSASTRAGDGDKNDSEPQSQQQTRMNEGQQVRKQHEQLRKKEEGDQDVKLHMPPRSWSDPLIQIVGSQSKNDFLSAEGGSGTSQNVSSSFHAKYVASIHSTDYSSRSYSPVLHPLLTGKANLRKMREAIHKFDSALLTVSFSDLDLRYTLPPLVDCAALEKETEHQDLFEWCLPITYCASVSTAPTTGTSSPFHQAHHHLHQQQQQATATAGGLALGESKSADSLWTLGSSSDVAVELPLGARELVFEGSRNRVVVQDIKVFKTIAVAEINRMLSSLSEQSDEDSSS